jgi:hypothetical protein
MSRVGLGKLPGDIAIHAGNTRIYLPIATSVVLSAWLMLIVGLLRHRRRGSSCRKQGDEAAEDPESTNENDE